MAGGFAGDGPDGASIAGGFFNSAMSFVGKKVDQEYRAQDRKSEQDFALGMSNSAVQRRMADLAAAGLNPILAAGQPASSSGGAGGGGSYGGDVGFDKGMHAVSSAAVARSQVALNAANADKASAEADEVRERTPSHEVGRELTSALTDQARQHVQESVQKVKNLQQEVLHSQASAANIVQQTKNLREMVPQIRATVELLKSQTGEVKQRVDANLPRLEAALMEMEGKLRQIQEGGHVAEASFQESFPAMLGRVMRALVPFGGIVGAVPLGGSAQRVRPSSAGTESWHPSRNR